MSQIVIELSMGTPPQKLNCSLNLITFHSFFLSHRIPNINITSFYNKSLSSTYKCSKELEEYKNEDFDQAEIFSDNIQFLSDDGASASVIGNHGNRFYVRCADRNDSRIGSLFAGAQLLGCQLLD